jgi:hypothetical protein
MMKKYMPLVLVSQLALGQTAQMNDVIKPMYASESFATKTPMTSRVIEKGLQNISAGPMKSLSRSFMQGLNQELLDVIQSTENKVKSMSKQEIIAQLNAMQQEMIQDLAGFGYPVAFDQEAVYKDLARLKTDLLKKQAVQNILLKYGLAK